MFSSTKLSATKARSTETNTAANIASNVISVFVTIKPR